MQRNTKLSTGNICKTYLKRKKLTSYPQKADHSPATKNKIEHKKATGRLGILPIPNWTIPIITLSETHFAVTFCIFSYTLIIRSLNLVVNGFRLSFLAMER